MTTQIISDVIVVGAGVVGLSCAIAAQSRGYKVAVVDKKGPAAGASAGNAGAFAFTDILPLASPGILRKAPRWLLDPLGPLTVRPSYALRIAPWMYRFWKACSPENVRRSTIGQTALMDLSRSELEPLLKLTGTYPMLRKDGNLQVYESEGEFRASLPGWEVRQRHGIEFQHLDAEGVASVQPGLSREFVRGTFTPGWFSIADPKLYTLALAEFFLQRGGQIVEAEVTSLKPSIDRVHLHTIGDQEMSSSQVVVSAGAHSHLLSCSVGDVIPLETERGYNTTLPADSFDLRTQVTFGNHGFVVTRLSTGIRVGGAVELAGLDLPPNYRRSEAMLRKAKKFLPALKTHGGRQWMGMRPSLPDSLPVIGHASATRRVIYAFGHGHLGLTQSAGTARIVVDLLSGSPPPIALQTFSPQRFAGVAPVAGLLASHGLDAGTGQL